MCAAAGGCARSRGIRRWRWPPRWGFASAAGRGARLAHATRDSAIALSKRFPIEPIDGASPESIALRARAHEMDCVLWSLLDVGVLADGLVEGGDCFKRVVFAAHEPLVGGLVEDSKHDQRDRRVLPRPVRVGFGLARRRQRRQNHDGDGDGLLKVSQAAARREGDILEHQRAVAGVRPAEPARQPCCFQQVYQKRRMVRFGRLGSATGMSAKRRR